MNLPWICGNVLATIETVDPTVDVDSFVTLAYTYQATLDTDRKLTVNPSLNNQVNTSGYDVKIVFSLEDYPTVTIDVPFTLTVLPCEIMSAAYT